MSKQLPIWDDRVFEFIDYCISHKIQGIKNEQDFIDKIGINSISTLKQIREGKASFRLKHLQQIGHVFGVTMDHFFGFTDRLYRDNVNVTPVEMLQSITGLITQQYGTKK